MSSDPNWEKQKEVIFSYLVQCTEIILFSRENNQIDVVIDVAIEPEDYENRWLSEYTFDTGFLGLLGDLNVSFTTSIYGRHYDSDGNVTKE